MLAQPVTLALVAVAYAHLLDGRVLPAFSWCPDTDTYEVGVRLDTDGQWHIEEIPADSVELELRCGR